MHRSWVKVSKRKIASPNTKISPMEFSFSLRFLLYEQKGVIWDSITGKPGQRQLAQGSRLPPRSYRIEMSPRDGECRVFPDGPVSLKNDGRRQYIRNLSFCLIYFNYFCPSIIKEIESKAWESSWKANVIHHEGASVCRVQNSHKTDLYWALPVCSWSLPHLIHV